MKKCQGHSTFEQSVYHSKSLYRESAVCVSVTAQTTHHSRSVLHQIFWEPCYRYLGVGLCGRKTIKLNKGNYIFIIKVHYGFQKGYRNKSINKNYNFLMILRFLYIQTTDAQSKLCTKLFMLIQSTTSRSTLGCFKQAVDIVFSIKFYCEFLHVFCPPHICQKNYWHRMFCIGLNFFKYVVVLCEFFR